MKRSSVMRRVCGPSMQAQDQLLHARRILGYSYVFAFFMFGQVMFADEVTPAQNTINQNLFEDQQQMLEQVVRPLLYYCSACCVILWQDLPSL